jgi:hypothetical protein
MITLGDCVMISLLQMMGIPRTFIIPCLVLKNNAPFQTAQARTDQSHPSTFTWLSPAPGAVFPFNNQRAVCAVEVDVHFTKILQCLINIRLHVHFIPVSVEIFHK